MADDIACGISAGIWLIVCVALPPFNLLKIEKSRI